MTSAGKPPQELPEDPPICARYELRVRGDRDGERVRDHEGADEECHSEGEEEARRNEMNCWSHGVVEPVETGSPVSAEPV
jgi:hypothetical protein